MKRIILLLIVLFNLFLMTGFLNKNKIPMVQVKKSVSATNKDLKTIDNKDTNLNNHIRVERESKSNVERGNTAQDIGEFIPNGWEILDIAEGDLNKDGILDKAIVIKKSGEDEISKRDLIIAFGNRDNTYTLSIRAKEAVDSANPLATYEPFEDIYVNRGSLVIECLYGTKYRFRYQDNGWYLIGFTDLIEHSRVRPQLSISQDFNLLTGDYEERRLSEGEVKKANKKLPKKSLINLKDFQADKFDSYYLLDYLREDTSDIDEFIPESYRISKTYNGMLAIAQGDFNKDGVSDKAFVIEHKENTDTAQTLLIALGNSKGGYTISGETKSSIANGTFRDLYVEDDNLVIKCKFGHIGEKNYISYKFTYLVNDWYLINLLVEEYIVISDEVYYLSDKYNLLTGVHDKTYLDDTIIKSTREYIQTNPYLKLADLNISENNYAKLVKDISKKME
ncbi:hypothetical protein [Wukongibacter sp. M2B1]|uniref:hypothetical protein n=1 Tax=Wukongibacter sp. M2B1 TaxID=3088895 RepID=UPI003D7A7871